MEEVEKKSDMKGQIGTMEQEGLCILLKQGLSLNLEITDSAKLTA